MSKAARTSRPISGTQWKPTRRTSASSGPRPSKPRERPSIPRSLRLIILRKLAPKVKRVGVERAFLPADAAELMARELPGVTFVEAHMPLERLRARKTREELDLLRVASELVVDSMLAVIASHGPGATKMELVEALRREEVNRGLTFEYCLITAGTSLNRAPSDQVWGAGDILSLNSGGNYKGYIGDLCRMAIQGEPDSELEDLLGEVDEIQMAARKPIRAAPMAARSTPAPAKC